MPKPPRPLRKLTVCQPFVCWTSLAIIAITILTCVSGRERNNGLGLPAGEGACKTPDVGFVVVGVDSPVLSNVKVYLIGNEGTRRIGRTDSFGFICIPYDLIVSPGIQAIVFCKKDFLCGGFLMADEDFAQFKERLIMLAPAAMADPSYLGGTDEIGGYSDRN